MATTPNTGTSYYLDTPAVRSACKDDFAKIDKACAPETERSDKNKHPVLRKMLGADRVKKLDAMADKIKGKHGFKGSTDNAWMSHCDGLWIKPGTDAEELKNFNDQIQHLSDDLGGAIQSQLKPLMDKVGQEIKEKAIAEAKEKALKAGGRAAARWGVAAAGVAAGGVGGVVTEAVATAWNICDWAMTGYDAVKTTSAAWGAISEMKTLLGVAQTAQSELQSLAGNMANKTPTELMADGMGVLSRLNACTRARRCLLVPYGKTDTKDSLGGKGCCPGQTGHHVLPDEMTKDDNCPGYTKDGAPTICAEGANNSNGTHGSIHRHLEVNINRHRTSLFGGPTLSYGKARDMGIKSIHQTFPESKCDAACLRAQLDAYYKDKCKSTLPAVAGVPRAGDRADSRAR
ncbi:hypothetical protein OU995_14020 [Roseateles sp. SL47]|uniref:HNH/endonuclease VII fold toxin-2 domain-containing protein n=1 Tax=Roseateles sp. SL47 TaxID=2995138 RepID=UPI002271E256|nr:HNH/endonuclease VII fold toxin-2 domain-containing protein [Roseateles sp. SL47]WAC75733.1 hypothetical protein OU995_14020 [Roseateles sp. SL47]